MKTQFYLVVQQNRTPSIVHEDRLDSTRDKYCYFRLHKGFDPNTFVLPTVDYRVVRDTLYWRTSDGMEICVSYIHDEHLKNIVSVIKDYKNHSAWRMIFDWEVGYRKAMAPEIQKPTYMDVENALRIDELSKHITSLKKSLNTRDNELACLYEDKSKLRATLKKVSSERDKFKEEYGKLLQDRFDLRVKIQSLEKEVIRWKSQALRSKTSWFD